MPRDSLTTLPPDGQLTPLSRFLGPRHWPIWAGLAVLRVLTLLPFGTQHAIGRFIGRLGARLVPKRRAIAATNIRLCFPEKPERDVDRLVTRTFESLGIGIFELCYAWWGNAERAKALITINGLENILKPLEQGRGIVLASAHLSAVEMVGLSMLEYRQYMYGLFRPGDNPFLNEILLRARSRALTGVIPKEDMRQMIRVLRQGKGVWYASDQSYRRKYSALVPFFGEPAMTSTALSHIARIGNALVVPFFFRRLEDGAGYVIDALPALENFPSDDPEADALRFHKLLEAQIRLAPEQYYWVHRRFKGRPDQLPDPYADI